MRTAASARPRLTVAGLLALTAAMGAGCGDNSQPGGDFASPSGSASASVTPSSSDAGIAEGGARGIFVPYQRHATAVTYDPSVVPAGATAQVILLPAADGVTVKLSVTGMLPRRVYGAHLHTDPCAATPAEAGPHYQHMPDPKAVASPPSVDPSYANPRNEVWLDFVTDALGSGTVDATQNWRFDNINPPRSLIVHAEQSKRERGKAGTAGRRVACLTLPD